MTTEQLRYFVGIVESGSFTKTAEAENVSQSSVTKQIQAFERELGVSLFQRAHRSAQLTQIGHACYVRCKELLEGYQALMRESHEYALRAVGTLHIVSLPILAQYGLMQKLQAFEQAHPELRLEISECEESALLEILRENRCDLAIVRREALPADVYETHPLATDELCCFANKSHPLAQRKIISPADIAPYPLMLMHPHTVIHQLCMSWLEAGGYAFRVEQCARIETILSGVETGRCVSLLMKNTKNIFHPKNIRAIPLSPRVGSEIVAVVSPRGGRNQNSFLLYKCLT